jgi:hypothetical protein
MAKLIQGVDYYLEAGKFVFTANYHLKRGYCCNSKCRHCPYGNAPSDPGPLAPGVRILGLNPLVAPTDRRGGGQGGEA